MADWAELAAVMERLVRLRTRPIAYKKLQKAEELEKISGVQRMGRRFTFCQLPTLVRRNGQTIGVTRSDTVGTRCARLHGLLPTTDEELKGEAEAFATTWFATAEVASKQMRVYPLIPPGEAVVLSPLAAAKFDPDVVLIYGSPAQLMLIMCGLQFRDYERFQFFFTGEGACADGLAQCYTSGKPALAIPCYGERVFGAVEEDELALALPVGMVAKAVEGVQALAQRGLSYPIPIMGPGADPSAALARIYPKWFRA